MKEHRIYCVESLTVISWLFYVFPRAARTKGKAAFLIYYLKATKAALFLARVTINLSRINATLKPLDFSLVDIKGENGDLVFWKALCHDSFVIQRYIKAHPEFQNVIRHYKGENRIPQFLIRHIMYSDYMNRRRRILPDMLFLIRVVTSPYYHSEHCVDTTFFFSSQKHWLGEVAKCVVQENVNIVPIRTGDFSIKSFMLKFDGLKKFLKQMLYYWMVIKHRIQHKESINDIQKTSPSQAVSPKIAVEYYGHLNLYTPQLNSDLFFCQQSDIPREDILIYFHHPVFCATDEKWREIKGFGMSAVALDPSATATPHVPVFKARQPHTQVIGIPSLEGEQGHDSKFIRKNLQRMLKDYQKKYNFWVDFISQHNIKMQVTWYKHDAKEYAMWDALQNTGGVGVIYQRSFEGAPDPWTISAPDVAFGFSHLGAQLGSDKESRIPYYVITGYLGDHRFPFVREQANHIRSLLLGNGARKIITYFDENSVDDPRWNVGHHATQENYAYLLNKVLELPWFGLILKPKMISCLRRRLGHVAGLLDQALATGRCFIFEEGHIIGSHPPATAALAADIVVHGHFFSATAGVESALAGAKTLLLDREGYSFSPLYKLGVGRVIFKNWDDLWQACQDNWNSSKAMPGFGDWSSVIDEVDPFRDGRAAQRMGTYLQWLMEGLKNNLPRETVLADAAERYTKLWGKDKILSINCSLKIPEYSSVK